MMLDSIVMMTVMWARLNFEGSFDDAGQYCDDDSDVDSL